MGTLKKYIKTLFCFVFTGPLNEVLDTIGVHVKFSTYPQHPLFGGFGGGGVEPPKYVKKYFGLLKQHVPKCVLQLWVFYIFNCEEGGGIVIRKIV